MSNKVTSYETSKALAEAGFEIEEYTGYWLAPLVTKNYKQPEPLWVNGRQHEAMEYRDAGGDINQNFYASYDCHDLLEWLRSERSLTSKEFYLMELYFLEARWAEPEDMATPLNKRFHGAGQSNHRDIKGETMNKELILKILLDAIMELECSAIERGSEIDHRFEIGKVAGVAAIVRELYEVKDAKSSNN
jgi:hypothetical protein